MPESALQQRTVIHRRIRDDVRVHLGEVRPGRDAGKIENGDPGADGQIVIDVARNAPDHELEASPDAETAKIVVNHHAIRAICRANGVFQLTESRGRHRNHQLGGAIRPCRIGRTFQTLDGQDSAGRVS